MIARGAIGNPYIFKQINDYMAKGTYDEPDKIALFFEYLELAKKYDISFGTINFITSLPERILISTAFLNLEVLNQ